MRRIPSTIHCLIAIAVMVPAALVMSAVALVFVPAAFIVAGVLSLVNWVTDPIVKGLR